MNKIITLLVVLFLSFNVFCINEIFIPEYILNEEDYLKYPEEVICRNIGWMGLSIDHEDQSKNPEKMQAVFYNLLENGMPIEVTGIGFIFVKYKNQEYAIESITSYYEHSHLRFGAPKKRSFSDKLIGERNYIQGDHIITLFKYDVDLHKYVVTNDDYVVFFNSMNCQKDASYNVGLYVVLNDGWVFEVYQNFYDYQPVMGKLNPLLLESLAEKVVDVYNAKKCKIKIEPHKWNLNWSEDNANPEGLINVWIGELEEGISVEDIDISTIVLNGNVPVTKNVGYENNEQFQGKILHLQFKKKDSFATVFLPKKGDKREICIEGKLKNGEKFIGRTEIEIIGKPKENK